MVADWAVVVFDSAMLSFHVEFNVLGEFMSGFGLDAMFAIGAIPFVHSQSSCWMISLNDECLSYGTWQQIKLMITPKIRITSRLDYEDVRRNKGTGEGREDGAGGKKGGDLPGGGFL